MQFFGNGADLRTLRSLSAMNSCVRKGGLNMTDWFVYQGGFSDRTPEAPVRRERLHLAALTIDIYLGLNECNYNAVY